MSYYEQKLKELHDLDTLVRMHTGELWSMAKLERQELDRRAQELEKENQQLSRDRKAVTQLAVEKSQGFPWLAKAYADYYYFRDLTTAKYLGDKSHPARKTAEHVREVARGRRTAEQLYRVLKYKLEYYETLFPWLVDFGEEGVDDLIKQTVESMHHGGKPIEELEDTVEIYTTHGEREAVLKKKLSRQELFQRALDRYWQKRKTRWEIGRDYERYCGYTYESKGWAVNYHGIVEGFADLGRDLICTKKDHAEIVQCKCWAKEYETGKPKEIHEKHIFQLYGTFIAYKIDNPDANTSARFVTSTFLSDRAWQFAKALGIKVSEDLPLQRYPCVKCNVSRRTGERIYHLPFDQQYDSTIVEEERNECYVETVEEAEALGFRRAFRWRGVSENSDAS